MTIRLSTKLDNWRLGGGGGYLSILFMWDISLIKYSPSLIFSYHPSLLCPLLSTTISHIISDMFNLILLLLSNIFSLIRSTHIFSLLSDMIQPNTIQSDLIFPLVFYKLITCLSFFCFYLHILLMVQNYNPLFQINWFEIRVLLLSELWKM